METLTFIKDIVAILLITAGLILFIIEIYGVFRFDFVLNRMHAAAIGDTLALSCTLLGLMLLTGFSFVTLKFFLVAMFLWFSSPVASHLIAIFEVQANNKANSHYKEINLKEEKNNE